MKNYYKIEKHWWFWASYVWYASLFILLEFFCIFAAIVSPAENYVDSFIIMLIPIFLIFLHGYLRWTLDKIEIKDGNFNSRLGIISIDKKNIPLDKISFITEKTNIISGLLGFGDIEVNSSAFGKAIKYACIKNPQEFIDFFNEVKP